MYSGYAHSDLEVTVILIFLGVSSRWLNGVNVFIAAKYGEDLSCFCEEMDEVEVVF